MLAWLGPRVCSFGRDAQSMPRGCPSREFLCHHQRRAHRYPILANPGGAPIRGVQLYRRVVQHPRSSQLT